MPVEKNMPLLQHLNEMRKMVITSVGSWLIAAMVLFFFFGDRVFQWITLPLTRLGLQLIIISPMEGFTVKMETCMFAGFVLVVPLILRQIWLFISPALYPQERRRIIISLGCSFFLFLAGMAFAYTLFLGVALQFLLFTAGAGLSPMLVAGKYFGFLMAVLIPFGLAFQMPVVFLAAHPDGADQPQEAAEIPADRRGGYPDHRRGFNADDGYCLHVIDGRTPVCPVRDFRFDFVFEPPQKEGQPD